MFVAIVIGTRHPGLCDDIGCFLLVMAGVQHLVRDPFAGLGLRLAG